MARDPVLSYRGALRILGKDQDPVLGTIDKLLGGIVLAAPALGGAFLAPLAALWGWVDQKNQLVELLRQLVDGGVNRVRGASGYQRHELIKAAHTVIVGTALFDAAGAVLAGGHAKAKLSETEKLRMVTGEHSGATNLLDRLYAEDAPMPSAGAGFVELLEHALPAYYRTMTDTLLRFLEGLAVWPALRAGLGPLPEARKAIEARSLSGYTSLYVRLAADVPEFFVWAVLQEHAATRRQLTAAGHDIATIIERQAGRLVRLELLLRELTANAPPEQPSLAGLVSRANRAALTASLAPEVTLDHGAAVTFPTLEQGYVTPGFRVAVHDDEARPAEEPWWERRPVRTDLDEFLAGLVAAPASATQPTLLLGHPGAGKSLLTRMIAARLPPESYVTVRVPLRDVRADASVLDQIDEALGMATNRRVTWAALSDEREQTTRVLLLDGLDELLLASGHATKAGYLREVEEFQQRELALQRPVVVIVTSRTIVADRTYIPAGTTLAQLADFDEAGVGQWLRAWNDVNRAHIFAGRSREVQPAAVLRQPDLARQPLLLLMLAIYGCDPQVPDLADGVSRADLYRRLLDTFIRREVGRGIGARSDDEIARARETTLWHLGIAAFAMFNRRDVFRVTDAELADDFAALLNQPSSALGAAAAERAISGFFFVQINTRRGVTADRRSYEFLHATFEEFLVALHAVELLGEIADRRQLSQRTTVELDRRLFTALLSYRCLAVRGTVLGFAAELFAKLPDERQRQYRETLNHLSSTARSHEGNDRPLPYRPQPEDLVRALAVYTANLVLLRVTLSPVRVALADLAPSEVEPAEWWRSTVRLWRAGLTDDEWSAVTSSVALRGAAQLRAVPVAETVGPDAEDWLGRLL